jgi:hypothetical protein
MSILLVHVRALRGQTKVLRCADVPPLWVTRAKGIAPPALTALSHSRPVDPRLRGRRPAGSAQRVKL